MLAILFLIIFVYCVVIVRNQVHKKLGIFLTGGVYTPYSPCMSTPLGTTTASSSSSSSGRDAPPSNDVTYYQQSRHASTDRCRRPWNERQLIIHVFSSTTTVFVYSSCLSAVGPWQMCLLKSRVDSVSVSNFFVDGLVRLHSLHSLSIN